MIGADTTFLVQLEVKEAPEHFAAHKILWNQIINPGVQLALAPQTLAEFVHIVSDPKRFQKPVPVSEAVKKARFWWNAAEVQQMTPSDASVMQFLDWMEKHQLGRKRILDTKLAATFWTAGVTEIITSNPSDFTLLGFKAIVP